MINTEGKITYHTIGNSGCIPRRRQYQSSKITTAPLELTQDEVAYIKEEISNKLSQHRLDHFWHVEAKLCSSCGNKHIPGHICQNPMDPKYITYD